MFIYVIIIFYDLVIEQKKLVKFRDSLKWEMCIELVRCGIEIMVPLTCIKIVRWKTNWS